MTTLPATGQARGDGMNLGLMAFLVMAVIAVGAGFTIRARAQR